MKKPAALLCALGVLSIPLPTLADDLGPIVITPTRTVQPINSSSATVYVVDSASIEASGATTTSELLRGIPGVQIEDLFGNGTQVNISVRGFSSTANANTLVLVNGRRLNYSDTTGPDLHHVFPQDIERIEVLSGSAGALYGDQAVGGVINIITKRPAEREHRISARAGSFAYGGLQFNSSMQLNDSLGYRFSAESFDTDHYRDHNAQSNTNFSGALEYNEAANLLFLEVQQINDELELPGALLEDEFEDDPKQVNDGFAEDFLNEDTSVFRVGYERDLDGHIFSIDTTARETDADVRQSFRDFPSPEDGFIDRKSSSVNPKLQGTIDSGMAVAYVVGIDLEETEYDLEIPFDFFGPGVTSSSNEQQTQSLYFQVNPQLSEQLELTVGMRSSSVENDMVDGNSFPGGIEVDDDVTVAELGLGYEVNDSTRVTARLDQNFRFAKVNELALAAPDTILDTQTGDSLEFGISHGRGNTQLVASLYRLDLENEIEFDPNAGLFGENVNLDKTRRDGLTLSVYQQVNNDLGISAQLGYVDAKFKSGSFDGNDISGVSDQIAKLRADLSVTDRTSTFLEYNYSSARYAQGDNANQFGKVGSITVYNAGLSYRYKSWQANLRINNLFDEDYAEFVTNNGFGAAYQPSPERNFFVSAAYQFD